MILWRSLLLVFQSLRLCASRYLILHLLPLHPCSFPQAEQVKEFMKDPTKFLIAAAPAAVAGGGSAPAATEEEKKEEVDDVVHVVILLLASGNITGARRPSVGRPRVLAV